jgi:EAL domain-containing protein (putative c-di-GMP-specific phosphodiesterase class I)
VLDHALRQTWALRRAGLDMVVAVNVSMRDLHDPDLPDALEHPLRKWEADPASLLLEITRAA